MTHPVIYVLNSELQRIDQVEGWSSFTCDLAWRGPGSWSLTLPGTHRAIPSLWKIGAGIEVTYEGEYLTSGPVRSYDRTVNDDEGDVYVLSGPDQGVALTGRRAEPCPAYEGYEMWAWMKGRKQTEHDSAVSYLNWLRAVKQGYEDNNTPQDARDPSIETQISEHEKKIPALAEEIAYWHQLMQGFDNYTIAIRDLEIERTQLEYDNAEKSLQNTDQARDQIKQNNERIAAIGEQIADLRKAQARTDRGVINDVRYPYAANDIQKGSIETLMKHYVWFNCGAAYGPGRAYPGLTIEEDRQQGRTLEYSVRFEPVKDVLDALSVLGEDMGYGVYMKDRVLYFYVRPVRDSSAWMSFEGDLVKEFKYSIAAPDYNDVLTAGTGEGTERSFLRGRLEDSIREWGLIEAPLKDERGTSDTVQLLTSVDEQLANAGTKRSFTLTVRETEGRRWRRDWNLGDKVQVRLGQGPINPATDKYAEYIRYTDIIRNLRLSWTEEEPFLTLEPTIGDPEAERPEVLNFLKRQRQLEKQVALTGRN